MEHLEIERKYLIRMPAAPLLEGLSSSEIEQIYLITPEGTRERIRRRVFENKTVYTHTLKKRLSGLSQIETEEEISQARFRELLALADPARRPVRKRRFLYEYDAQVFEIDVYPFWGDRALMELELESEKQEIRLPPEIKLVREVTFDKCYSNSAIAREIPRERIEKEV